MSDTVSFELVSPEKLLMSEDCEMVVVPGTEGDFGVLAGHAPMISSIRPGVIEVHEGTSVTHRLFVSGGLAEVTNERLTVLAEEATPVNDIDKAAATKRLEDAKQAEQNADDANKAKAEAERRVAEAMVAAAG